MTKIVSAIAIVSVYGALSAWLAHREGEAYRDALRIARSGPASQPSAPAPGPAPAPLVEAAATHEEAAKPAPRVEHKKERDVSHPPAHVAQTHPAPSHPAPSPARTAEPPKPAEQPSVESSAWLNTLDLSKLKPDEEVRLGAALNAYVLARIPATDGGDWLERITDVARPLLEARSRKEVEYQFIILKSEAKNAFSHPGGYIYVCKGLLDMIGEDEDGVLEFILGHEIAHVDLNHAIQTVAPSAAEAKRKGRDVVSLFLTPIGLGHPDRLEFEADSWILKIMARLDRTPRERLAFLRKFEDYSRRHGFKNGHKPPDPDWNVFEHQYQGLAPTYDRLRRAQVLVTGQEPASGSSR